jgi:hypothetical protein
MQSTLSNVYSMLDASCTGKFNADGILQSGERLVVPEGRRLRLRLFEEFHDSQMEGYFGQEKTYLEFSRRFYWPDMEALCHGVGRDINVRCVLIKEMIIIVDHYTLAVRNRR